MKAPVVLIAVTVTGETLVPPKAASRSTPREGPVRKPATRLVTVIPSCAPERLVEVRDRARSTKYADFEPESAAFLTSFLLTVR